MKHVVLTLLASNTPRPKNVSGRKTLTVHRSENLMLSPAPRGRHKNPLSNLLWLRASFRT